MPPRLPTLGAPALPSPCLTRALFSSARALFSSTARAGFDFPNNRPGPAFDFPNRPPPPPASSTSKLLSLDRRHGPFSRGAAPRRAGDAAERLIDRYRDRAETAGRRKQAQIDLMYKSKDSQDYLRQMPRRFEAGDVYSPHDLSSVEMAKWRRRRGPRNYDVIDTLGIRPLDMYKNFSLIQDFTSSSGQVMHSSATGLRPVNQRKIAKMIRRVQGMGIYPSIHDHPEMLRADFFPPLNVDR